MGNVESQNGDIYGDVSGHLSRKNSSRSLRVSNKQLITRRPRHYSSAKQEHRNSEASTRSSSTPSIPQSLAESSLEPFNATDAFGEFGNNPNWTQRVAVTMRPDPYQNDDDPLATPTPETSEADTVPHDGGEDSMGEGEEDIIGEVRYLQRMSEGTREPGSFKKKRSKSADMWREDSLEFSLSDLSQEHLTSTEEIIGGGEEEEEEEQFTHPRGNAGEAGVHVGWYLAHRNAQIPYSQLDHNTTTYLCCRLSRKGILPGPFVQPAEPWPEGAEEPLHQKQEGGSVRWRWRRRLDVSGGRGWRCVRRIHAAL